MVVAGSAGRSRLGGIDPLLRVDWLHDREISSTIPSMARCAFPAGGAAGSAVAAAHFGRGRT